MTFRGHSKKYSKIRINKTKGRERYGTFNRDSVRRADAKTDGISSMVWKYYGYPTLDDLYADVVGDNADYSLVEDAVDNTK